MTTFCYPQTDFEKVGSSVFTWKSKNQKTQTQMISLIFCGQMIIFIIIFIPKNKNEEDSNRIVSNCVSVF